MNLLLTIYLSATLYGGNMDSVWLAEGIYLNVWQSENNTAAQIVHNGKESPTYTIRCNKGNYSSVKCLDSKRAKVTYEDGSEAILHVVDGCVTVMDEKEKK